MTAQDTENQAGGADPQDEPGAPDAPDAPEAEAPPADPQPDELNPYEKLKADALQLIIHSRQIAQDPVEIVKIVLAEIAD